MMPPLDPIGPLDPLDPSRPAQEKWGGAKWTPECATKLNRAQCSDPGFDIRTETERTLRAAMRHGVP